LAVNVTVIENIEPYFSKEPIFYQIIAASHVPQRACFAEYWYKIFATMGILTTNKIAE
jgi:hypothetical protein